MTSRRSLKIIRKWLLKRIARKYKKIVPAFIKKLVIKWNSLSIVTNRSNVYALLLFLRDHTDSQYKTLTDIIAYDVPGKFYRFVVIYSLLSLRFFRRINIYIHTNEVLWLNSVTTLFSSAGWQEREIWDCYGIFFKNHTDLRRLLSDYGFQGFAFRKDFPLMGFVEIHYSEKDKLIRYDVVEASAEYRNYRWNQQW